MDVRTADKAMLDSKIIQLERKGRFLLFSELEVQSNKEWTVHNLLGHGEASALYGKPGDGKSVLAEDLGLHVATGRPWHAGPVLKGCVRVRSPNTAEQCSPMFAVCENARLAHRIAVPINGSLDIEVGRVRSPSWQQELTAAVTAMDAAKLGMAPVEATYRAGR